MLTLTSTLAYCIVALFTVLKCFIVSGPRFRTKIQEKMFWAWPSPFSLLVWEQFERKHFQTFWVKNDPNFQNYEMPKRFCFEISLQNPNRLSVSMGVKKIGISFLIARWPVSPAPGCRAASRHCRNDGTANNGHHL